MYQVIARKYRPQSFSELVNQEHVKTTLENAIAQRRIAHGYIFSGQRGTGKTTVARILARCLNCIEGPTVQPCGRCASCVEIAGGGALDVIEIDAASNRGINEMRELRENVRYRPARDRYKVFIIDEAHQITSEAFNALLKTLEEPPEWVVFVLCTTEAHKIPATIASRCQHFSFRSVNFEEIIGRMEWICRQEGIEADAEVLAVLAQAGDGSVRDSLSALDQAIACCGSRLNAAEVRQLLGQFSLDALDQVSEALRISNTPRMLEIVDELVRKGRHLQHFCRELARYFRNLLVAKITGRETRLIGASSREQARLREVASQFSEEDLTRYLQLTLDLFRDLQFSLQPRLHLELGLVRLVQAGKLLPIEEAISMLESTAPPPPGRPTPAPGARPAPTSRGGPSPLTKDIERKATAPGPDAGWKERLLAELDKAGMTFIADAVRHSEVAESGNELCFTAPREFCLALQSQDLRGAVAQVAPRLKPRVIPRDSEAPAATPAPGRKPPEQEDEVTRRALGHPEVQRFQELFGGHVRQVRNLKE